MDVIGSQSTSGNAWTYLGYDGLGSLRQRYDANGGLGFQTAYDPYGYTPREASASYGYTGEFADANGLLYLRARYYNPGLGTFMSQDPFPGVPTLSMSLNGYSYVHGNPVNLTDPSGQFPPLLLGIVVGAIIGAGVSVGIDIGAQMLIDGRAFNCLDTGSVIMSAIEGAFFGALGGGIGALGQLKQFKHLSRFTRLAGEALVDFSVSIAWDVSVRGGQFGEAFWRNLASGLVSSLVVDNLIDSALRFAGNATQNASNWALRNLDFSAVTTGPAPILRNALGRAWQYTTAETVLDRLPKWLSNVDKKGIPLIGPGLRKPVNWRYIGRNYFFDPASEMGQLYPLGVDFDNQGFPIFDPYVLTNPQGVPYVYTLPEGRYLHGQMPTDRNIAEGALNPEFNKQDPSTFLMNRLNGIWHHLQDGRTIMLVPERLHREVPHSGGEAVIEHFLEVYLPSQKR